MGRRKSELYDVAELMADAARRNDPYADEEDLVDDGPVGARIDRNAHRDRQAELREQASQLARLPPRIRDALPFDDELKEVLRQLHAAEMRPDRRRHLLRAKLLLNQLDPAVVQAALRGETEATAREALAVRWRTRIIDGDDAVLQAFMAGFPNADRQALRTAAREARGKGPAAQRAFTRLFQLLRDGMAAGAAAPVEDAEE